MPAGFPSSSIALGDKRVSVQLCLSYVRLSCVENASAGCPRGPPSVPLACPNMMSESGLVPLFEPGRPELAAAEHDAPGEADGCILDVPLAIAEAEGALCNHIVLEGAADGGIPGDERPAVPGMPELVRVPSGEFDDRILRHEHAAALEEEVAALPMVPVPPVGPLGDAYVALECNRPAGLLLRLARRLHGSRRAAGPELVLPNGPTADAENGSLMRFLSPAPCRVRTRCRT